MATYATAADLTAYLAASGVACGMDPDALLVRAEHDVDRAVGPRATDPVTGLKFSLADLSDAQVASLRDATCAAAEWRITTTERELIAGGDDYIPTELRVLRVGGRVSPKMLEALAGSGLVSLSGTVSTT
jgi:hypothetical protein